MYNVNINNKNIRHGSIILIDTLKMLLRCVCVCVLIGTLIALLPILQYKLTKP